MACSSMVKSDTARRRYTAASPPLSERRVYKNDAGKLRRRHNRIEEPGMPMRGATMRALSGAARIVRVPIFGWTGDESRSK